MMLVTQYGQLDLKENGKNGIDKSVNNGIVELTNLVRYYDYSTTIPLVNRDK